MTGRTRTGRPGAAEVVGSSRTERFRAAERRIATVSRILDDLVEVPGTGRRVGLDPVLGFVPILGDAVSAAAGFWIVAEAARFELPRLVLARMVLNVIVDLALGAIPFLGDLFDFVSKANARNLALFRRHATDPHASTTDTKALFLGLALLLVGLLWLVVQAVGWLLGELARLL